MVLKFRQETIKKLEKSFKEQDHGSENGKDAIIVSYRNIWKKKECIFKFEMIPRTSLIWQENLRVELQAATAINEYHPEVAKLKAINKKLSVELSTFKSSIGMVEAVQKDKNLQDKLESTFKELQHEQHDQGQC